MLAETRATKEGRLTSHPLDNVYPHLVSASNALDLAHSEGYDGREAVMLGEALELLLRVVSTMREREIDSLEQENNHG